jgi:hypothetical protein
MTPPPSGRTNAAGSQCRDMVAPTRLYRDGRLELARSEGAHCYVTGVPDCAVAGFVLPLAARRSRRRR